MRPMLFQQRGILSARRHDYAAASAHFQAAQEGFAAAGDVWGEAYAWYGMGWMHEWSGRSSEAREAHREAKARFAASDNPHGEIEVLCSLGAIERRAERTGRRAGLPGAGLAGSPGRWGTRRAS